MSWITDSLRTAIGAVSRFSPFGSNDTGLPNVFTHQIALAAYMSSGMMRKVIKIPAADRTREWRDWQAEKDAITAIEEEEKRLGLRAKVKHAEILRGVGGGALILITAGSHAEPLNPETIAKGDLVAVNVASRWEITAKDFDRDLASQTYRQPGMFEVSSNGRQTAIHPSRVICFRGDPIPAGSAVNDEEAFWGDSRLLQVYREVVNADNAQGWFAELVKKAKLLRIGIPNITDYTSTPDGQRKLDARIATIAEGESALNATVYSAKGGPDQPGEEISDYQVTWNGIPAMMDAFDQRVAAVSDIPFTRLMGRSPAGLNATGKSDQDNWDRAVADGQENETRPCLEALDPFLIRSAGVDPEGVTWTWAPLWTPTEQEEATTFKTTMEAVEKVQNTGAIPEKAFAKGLQNLLVEREYMPGLDQALDEIPENERYGIEAPGDDDSDPSALTEGGGPNAGRPFADARGGRKGRMARQAKGFDQTQPRGRDGRWIDAGTRSYIDAAAKGGMDAKQRPIGTIGKRAAERINRAGLDVSGKSVAIDASAVRHTLLRHGHEPRPGQKSITGADLGSSRSILNGVGTVRKVRPAKTGAPRFAGITQSKGERIYAIYEVRKRAVTVVTMWIRK